MDFAELVGLGAWRFQQDNVAGPELSKLCWCRVRDDNARDNVRDGTSREVEACFTAGVVYELRQPVSRSPADG